MWTIYKKSEGQNRALGVGPNNYSFINIKGDLKKSKNYILGNYLANNDIYSSNIILSKRHFGLQRS